MNNSRRTWGKTNYAAKPTILWKQQHNSGQRWYKGIVVEISIPVLHEITQFRVMCEVHTSFEATKLFIYVIKRGISFLLNFRKILQNIAIFSSDHRTRPKHRCCLMTSYSIFPRSCRLQSAFKERNSCGTGIGINSTCTRLVEKRCRSRPTPTVLPGLAWLPWHRVAQPVWLR